MPGQKLEEMYLQSTDKPTFEGRIAELRREGWTVEKQTKKPEYEGEVYNAALTRPKQG